MRGHAFVYIVIIEVWGTCRSDHRKVWWTAAARGRWRGSTSGSRGLRMTASRGQVASVPRITNMGVTDGDGARILEAGAGVLATSWLPAW